MRYNRRDWNYDVPSVSPQKAGLHLPWWLAPDGPAVQRRHQGHNEWLFPAPGRSASAIRFRTRPEGNPHERRYFQGLFPGHLSQHHDCGGISRHIGCDRQSSAENAGRAAWDGQDAAAGAEGSTAFDIHDCGSPGPRRYSRNESRAIWRRNTDAGLWRGAQTGLFNSPPSFERFNGPNHPVFWNLRAGNPRQRKSSR